jgi:putative endopeptidase
VGDLFPRCRRRSCAARDRGAEHGGAEARADLRQHRRDTLRAWQAFHTTERAAPLLSRQFVDAQFDFRSKFLQGQPQQRERWKPATKQEALAKLETFTVRIGHPDEWRDYSALDVRPDDLFGNAMRARQFDWNATGQRLGKPVERGEWGMTRRR